MARLLKVLLGMWLTGMLVSGSAFAAVRELDLGLLTPGSAQGLFGTFPFGIESTDIYEFDLGGAPISTVGVSALSLLTVPGSADASFDLTIQLLEWNGLAFVPIPGTDVTSVAVVSSADLAAATGGGNFYDRHYELTVTATPTGSGVASYGGSISAVVPEPSLSLLVIGGLVSIAFLGRRRLTGAAA